MPKYKYSDEQRKFLIEFCPNHSYKEIMSEYEKKFNCSISFDGLRSFIRRNKTYTGRKGKIKKDEICLGRYNVLRQKDGSFKLKSHVVYENATGDKIRQNECIVYLDGNPHNCDINNLMKVTRGELFQLNNDHTLVMSPEMYKTKILLAKIKVEKRKKERKG